MPCALSPQSDAVFLLLRRCGFYRPRGRSKGLVPDLIFNVRVGELHLISVEGTFGSSHGDYIALEGAVQDVPCALVDDKWSQCVVSRVLVGF